MKDLKEKNNGTNSGLNIDDAWWVNEIGSRREEIRHTEEKQAKLELNLKYFNKMIKEFNDKIADEENKIEIANIILQLQIPLATVSLLVSLLAGGLKLGLITWSGVTAVQVIGSIGTEIVKSHYKKQIERLEDERGTYDIGSINCSNEINMLKNKITVLRGQSFPKKNTRVDFKTQDTYRGLYESDCPFDKKNPNNFDTIRMFEILSNAGAGVDIETEEVETDDFTSQDIYYQYNGSSESLVDFNSTVFVSEDSGTRNAAMAKLFGEEVDDEELSSEVEDELVRSKIEDFVEEINADEVKEDITEKEVEPETPSVDDLNNEDLNGQYDELCELFSHSDGVSIDSESQKLAAILLDGVTELNAIGEQTNDEEKVKQYKK